MKIPKLIISSRSTRLMPMKKQKLTKTVEYPVKVIKLLAMSLAVTKLTNLGRH